MVDSLQVHLDLLMVDSHQASTEVQLEVLQEDSTLSQPSPLFRTAKFLTQLTEVASSAFTDSIQATKNASQSLNSVMAIMFKPAIASDAKTNSPLKQENVWIKNVPHGRTINVRVA